MIDINVIQVGFFIRILMVDPIRIRMLMFDPIWIRMFDTSVSLDLSVRAKFYL